MGSHPTPCLLNFKKLEKRNPRPAICGRGVGGYSLPLIIISGLSNPLEGSLTSTSVNQKFSVMPSSIKASTETLTSVLRCFLGIEFNLE
jgi:hypothetical protein